MTPVVVFENHEAVFNDVNKVLQDASNLNMRFVDYIDLVSFQPSPASDVAQQALAFVRSAPASSGRCVFVVDLNPQTNLKTADYGLHVIEQLAYQLGMGLRGFLASDDILVAILSAYLDSLAGNIESVWPNTEVAQIGYMPGRMSAGEALNTFRQSQDTPRLLVADRLRDVVWLCEAIRNWG